MGDLSGYDEEYAQTSTPSAYPPIPDDRYEVEIVKIELTKTAAGDDAIKWRFKITGGKYAGRLLFKTSVIKSGEPMKYLKGDLERVGLMGTLSENAEGFPEMTGVKISVTKKASTKNSEESWVFIGNLLEKAPF